MAAKSLVPLLYRLFRNPKNPLSLSTRTLSSFTSATLIDLHAYMIKNLSPENLKTELMVCMLDMCCALRNEGFALQASDIFPVAHERYNVPRIVHETLLIRFLLDNGMPRQAIVAYQKMKTVPNTYTFTVLTKGLAKEEEMLGEAKKILMDMIKQGMRPNAGTCVALMEGYVRERKEEEGRGFVTEMKKWGCLPEEKSIREVLKDKPGSELEGLENILF